MPSTRLNIVWWHWRRRFVIVAVLAASSYLAADLTNLFMGATIEASMPPSQPAGAPAALPPPSVDTSAILQGNLFNPNQRGNATAAPAESAPAPAVIESTHRLIGTVTGAGDFGFAVLEEKSNNAQNLYRVGDLLPGGAQLVSIERYAVTIRVGTTIQRLAVQDDVPLAVGTSGPAVAAGGVREVAANHWLIERAKIDAALANLPRLLTQARLIPNFSGGKADGFRLLNMQAGSFFTEIGLQEGDVLQRINGIEVNDPQNLLKAFQQLRNESAINVDLQRQSQPVTLAYEIR
jgi:general secretion pathway protein C